MTPEDKPTLFSPGVGKRGMTRLHYAAYCGNMDELKVGLEEGVDVNERDTYRGYSALLWLADMASTGGRRLEMLELLIRHGADTNLLALNGSSAYSLALAAGSETGDRMAEILLAHRA